MTLPSDRDLVEGCLAGDSAAWSALLGRYLDLVYGLARQAGLEDARAQDVVQEVSLALWKGLPKLRRAERLLAWVIQTTRREAWKQGRRQRATAKREARQARAEADLRPLPQDELARAEEEQTVREALGALEERCRRLLRALYFEPVGEQGYDALSEALGMPRGSIGPTRARCLEKLAQELAGRGLAPASDVSGARGSGSLPRKPRTP